VEEMNIVTPGAGQKDRFHELAQCNHNTGMGQLLRRFWQPVSPSIAIEKGKAKLIKIMGEELTLFRGESGRPYLVAGRCAHRLTRLDTGWVQGEEIRCIYHGWKYDGAGQCREAPAESPEFAARVKIAGYPVREYANLIFAYLGDGEAPEFDLPRKDVLETDQATIIARTEVWPCNWLQLVENSLDAVHVSFVHHAGKVGPFGEAVSAAIPDLEYVETDAGIRQIATRGKGNVRESDWTFPNYNHIVIPSKDGGPWIDTCVWRVPIDLTTTLRIGVYAINTQDMEVRAKFVNYMETFGAYDPANHHDDLFDRRLFPEDKLLQLTSAQDYVAALGQGSLPDRDRERLGKSDAGIVMLRRLFWRELEALRGSGQPKTWRRLPDIGDLPTQRSEVQIRP
jgi:5,5'-dehydrodivanillate O-demethylase